jgi:hypothetical protein
MADRNASSSFASSATRCRQPEYRQCRRFQSLDLKVTWGTYPNDQGHVDYPGCFRCHDDSHSTSDKKTNSQDCGACHQSLAVEEAAPEILKMLGLEHK